MSLQEITPEEKARLCDQKTSRELVEQRRIWQGRIIALKEDLVRVRRGRARDPPVHAAPGGRRSPRDARTSR